MNHNLSLTYTLAQGNKDVFIGGRFHEKLYGFIFKYCTVLKALKYPVGTRCPGKPLLSKWQWGHWKTSFYRILPFPLCLSPTLCLCCKQRWSQCFKLPPVRAEVPVHPLMDLSAWCSWKGGPGLSACLLKPCDVFPYSVQTVLGPCLSSEMLQVCSSVQTSDLVLFPRLVDWRPAISCHLCLGWEQLKCLPQLLSSYLDFSHLFL